MPESLRWFTLPNLFLVKVDFQLSHRGRLCAGQWTGIPRPRHGQLLLGDCSTPPDNTLVFLGNFLSFASYISLIELIFGRMRTVDLWLSETSNVFGEGAIWHPMHWWVSGWELIVWVKKSGCPDCTPYLNNNTFISISSISGSCEIYFTLTPTTQRFFHGCLQQIIWPPDVMLGTGLHSDDQTRPDPQCVKTGYQIRVSLLVSAELLRFVP